MVLSATGLTQVLTLCFIQQCNAHKMKIAILAVHINVASEHTYVNKNTATFTKRKQESKQVSKTIK